MLTNTIYKQQKSKLRQVLKATRTQLNKDTYQYKSQSIIKKTLQLNAIQAANNIFIYISHGSEVHTHNLIDELLNIGKTLAVPKIINDHDMHAVYMTGWKNMTTDRMGILTPTDSQHCTHQFDVVITPGLGFTLHGQRIGYGRGYYDKWFSKHDTKHKIGLAFEIQLLDTMPTETTDIAMDKIVTEKRVITV